MNPLPCPVERWPEFSRLLDAGLELTDEQRPAWLDNLAEPHRELRPWLAKVLLAEVSVRTGDFLHQPRIDQTAESEHQPGNRIGPWELLRPLGEGGMGEVWLAARADGAYEREVALKLPHAHLLAGSVRARFNRERDILAGLNHPHIARFYDAGLGQDGQPFLSLEYVDGVPLDTHCEQGRLDLRARIELMLQILAAVQYAHGRLVVHRDLKPSNVLVTADGQIKLLDFGIAKLLETDEPGIPLTRHGGSLATPAYAAPEQLAGDAITVATDGYALGVMLYELLCGARPCSSRSQRTVGGEAEVPLVSERVQPEHAPSTGLNVPRLRRALRGDLDSILAKALAHEPARRYASLEAMAADLQRHLRHQPIHARHIGALTRAGLFVRRHRTGVTFSAALAASVLAGVIVSTSQYQSARRAQLRAAATSQFLTEDMVAAANPLVASTKNLTVREMLRRGSVAAHERFRLQPDVEADIHFFIGHAQYNLDHHADAAAELLRGYGLARQLGRDKDPSTWRLMETLGFALDAVDRHVEALAIRQDLQALRGASLGPHHADTLFARALVARSQFNLGDYANALATAREVIRDLGSPSAERSGELAKIAGELASTLTSMGGAEQEAEPLLQLALRFQQRQAGNDGDDYQTLVLRMNLVHVLRELGHFIQAQTLLDQVLADVDRNAASTDFNRVYARMAQGNLQLDQRQAAEAESTFLSALGLCDTGVECTEGDRLKLNYWIARARLSQGVSRDVADTMQSLVSADTATHAPDHPCVVDSRLALVEALRRQGDSDRAWDEFARISPVALGRLPPLHPTLVKLERERGLLCAERADLACARNALVWLENASADSRGNASWRLQDARADLAQALARLRS